MQELMHQSISFWKPTTFFTYENCLSTYTSRVHKGRHLKRSAVDASRSESTSTVKRIRRSIIFSLQWFKQCYSCRKKCYIKIDPKYPNRCHESYECRVLDRGKEKLFSEVILYVYGFLFFFFWYSQDLKQIMRLKRRRCFIMPRTSSKVDLSFQTIVAFLSSSGSGMEYVFYEL